MLIKLLVCLALAGTSGSHALASDNAECGGIKLNSKRLQCYDAKFAAKQDGVSKAVDSTSSKWAAEPGGFLTITLDQLIEKSMPSVCPADDRGVFSEYQWGKIGKPRCHLHYPTSNPRYAVFAGHGVEDFRQTSAYLYGENLVGRINATFFSAQYSEILTALTQKYGPPTMTTSTTLRLNSGAEFPNTVSMWLGEKATLTIEALGARGGTGRATDYGQINLTSHRYRDYVKSEEDKASVARSSKF